MKRKLALLLAAAMTLSLLPTTLFASSNNTLTSSVGTISAKTVMVEANLMPNSSGTTTSDFTTATTVQVSGNLVNAQLKISESNDIKYVQGAPYLRIEPKSTIDKGSRIGLTLEGAEWYFKNSWGDGGIVDDSSINRLSIGGGKTLYELTSSGALKGSGNITGTTIDKDVMKKALTLGQDNNPTFYNNNAGNTIISGVTAYSAFNLERTYRTNLLFTDTLATGNVFADFDGTSYRRATKATAGTATVGTDLNDNNTLYTMTISADKKSAWLTFNQAISDSNLGTIDTTMRDPIDPDNGKFVYIPLVVRTLSTDGDVKVTLNGNNTGVSNGTFVFGSTASSGTETYVDDPKTAREEFPINLLIIKEIRAGAMGDGTFEFSAPNGYTFNEDALGDIELYAENFGYNNNSSASYKMKKGSSFAAKDLDYYIDWKYVRGEEDYSTIQVQLNNLSSNKSNVNGTPGVLILKDDAADSDHETCFRLYADDGAAFDADVNLSIREVSGKTGITRQNDIKAGTRKDWTINFKTITDVPTLINGRYFDDDAKDADDETHLAATVLFEENVANAWWSGRVTTFQLPEGVKFRKAEIHDTENLKVGHEEELELEAFLNSNSRKNHVTVNGNEMTISGVEVLIQEGSDALKKKAKLELDVWVSIESGFEGDVTLTATGSALQDELDPIVIAKAISPVTLKAEVSDVQIGHQYIQVADITIQENVAGALEKNKQVWITVTDRIYQDMWFTPGYSVERTDGNISIKDRGIAGGSVIQVGNTKTLLNSSSNAGDLGGGTIVLDVDTASSVASTIKLSNLQLKVNRAVPESTLGYDVYVWGPNVAPNSDVFDYSTVWTAAPMPGPAPAYVNNDLHSALGIHTQYVKVVTPADGVGGSALSAVVKVTVDSKTAYRDGNQVAIDPAPFIDGSSRLQVPVRALANLLGVTNEEIIWSDADRTVTLNMSNNRTVQFTIGSSIVKINGADVRMDTEAMIKDDWTFIPFRALGEALGVQVSWDDATKTATFNADKEVAQ